MDGVLREIRTNIVGKQGVKPGICKRRRIVSVILFSVVLNTDPNLSHVREEIVIGVPSVRPGHDMVVTDASKSDECK